MQCGNEWALSLLSELSKCWQFYCILGYLMAVSKYAHGFYGALAIVGLVVLNDIYRHTGLNT